MSQQGNDKDLSSLPLMKRPEPDPVLDAPSNDKSRDAPKAWGDDVALLGPNAPRNDGKIKHLIEYLLTVYDRFGNTVVTTKGLQWGSSALWKMDEQAKRIEELESELAAVRAMPSAGTSTSEPVAWMLPEGPDNQTGWPQFFTTNPVVDAMKEGGYDDLIPLYRAPQSATTSITPLVEKVAKLADLKANWDSYGAEAFPERTVTLAMEIAATLDDEWKCVPCADGPSVCLFRGDEEDIIEVRTNAVTDREMNKP